MIHNGSKSKLQIACEIISTDIIDYYTLFTCVYTMRYQRLSR